MSPSNDRGLAVVSGGGTGIGLAVAHELHRAGHRVVVVGRRRDPLDAAVAQLAGARAYQVDLTGPDEVQLFAEALAVDEPGPIDVIVNNAGGVATGEASSLSQVAERWTAAFTSNVLSAVLLTTALRPRLRRPGGRVVSISSIAALRGGGGSYSAAKAALHGWNADLAAELGPDGITVNLVAPGYVAETEFFGDRMTGPRHQRLVAGTLVGRAGTPQDIASGVAFLASPEAGYLTGQIIQINGGALLGRG